jgi:signal transduction histidine kinase/AraC-like DNA-binding protein/ligand-binding sensor domain-containing protein
MDDFINFGLRTLDKESGTFSYIRIDSSFNENENETSSGYVAWILSGNEQELWFGTDCGLRKYDFDENLFRTYVPFPGDKTPFMNEVISIGGNGIDNLWIGTRFGLMSFNKKKKEFGSLVKLDPQPYPYFGLRIGPSSGTSAIQEDVSGYLWMIVEGSLWRILPSADQYLGPGTALKWKYKDEGGGINRINSLLVDNPGNIWLPAYGYGICHVIKKTKKFRTFIPAITTTYQIYSIYEDKENRLWMAGNSPVISIEPESHKQTYSWVDSNEFINCINEDRYGNLWLASRMGYVVRSEIYKGEKINFKYYFPDESDPTSLTRWKDHRAFMIITMSYATPNHVSYRDNNGDLWFNTGLGLHDRYDPDLDGFYHLDHRKIDYINNDTCIQREIKGEIWLPSMNGLLRLLPPFSETPGYKITPAKIMAYRHDPADPNSLSSNRIRSIYFSRNLDPGIMWIGTMGGGLSRMTATPAEGTVGYRISFKNYTKTDGLCDNNIIGILEDKLGNLWLSTLNGLSKFNPEMEKFENFFEADGLPTNQFAMADPLQDKNGNMYFPTEFGLLSFYPDSILMNQIVPPVVITRFLISNQPVHPGEHSPLKDDISHTKEIELAYNQNFIAFEFCALNYVNPEKNQYRYMLEGLDKDWIQAGTRRYAEYTNLRHGDYTFRVSGSNNDGIWNEDGTSVQITIHPPPWQTWYAYLVYGLLIIAIILWYRRYLQNRARLRMAVEMERIEKEKILEMDQMRSRFFANISHEFRTPLTLIRGPLDELNRIKSGTITLSRDLLSVMRRNTMRLQRLINQLLELSKLETGKATLQVSGGNLDKFVKTIILSFLSLAESRQIKYEYNASETPRKAFFDPDKVEKILTNLISNAFKYTSPGGTVSVRLEYKPPLGSNTVQPVESEPFAELMVSDTGIGIPPDKLKRIFDRFYQVSHSDTREEEGTGIGLALTKELVDLYRGEIRVESEPGKGSMFCVRLPVSKEQFREEEILVPDKEVRAEPLEQVMDLEEPELAETREIRSPGKGKDAPVILIVEDNVDLRNYISGNLVSSYKVLMAENGKLGLECAVERIPDLVVSDVMMPVMDGMEMCSLLKQDQRTSHIPVIMLTAKADRGSKMEGLETGADDYIIKPFDAEELQVRVKNLIEQRKRLREKFMREFSAEHEWHIPSSPDDQLLHKILDILNEHLSEPEFNVDQMSDILNMSRRQLFRKTSAVTGYTPKDLIRNLRLKKAASLFRSGHKHVAQVMHQVGFNSQSHFGKCFSEFYGMPPSKYINQKHS